MPKLIDLTGKRFGKLIVLSRNKNNTKNNHPQWNCKCDCGKEVVVQGGHLRSGHTQSCGCVQKKIAGNINFKDISNQKFGNLTAIKYIKSNNRGSAIWKCRCDCGNTVEVSGTDLRTGHTKSCGCINSFGESKIQKLLELNHIPFEKQKMFNNCRFPQTNQMARFDFFVNGRYLIEYDGKQHFGSGGWEKDNFQKIQMRDNYKTQWCKENNIPLIRIPYTAYETLSTKDLLLTTTKYRVV